ncbi:MAG: universal stress protein [Chloroflexi bacterium]|nr:universal stress protein [Chloroflexota bacterium]
MTIKTVLVPLDGSELAERTLGTAADLAAKLSASLVLVTILGKTEAGRAGPGPSAASGRARGDAAQAGESPEAAARRYLEGRAAQLTISGTVRSLVRFGDAATAIVEAAAAEAADMIAMTTRGRSGLARGLLGSVTDRVIQISQAPVLVMRPETAAPSGQTARPFSHVVVPLDGSQRAELALPLAGEMARAYGARLDLVRVVSLLQVGYAAELYVPVAGYDPYSREELEKDAAEYLERVATAERGKGLTVDCHVSYGNPRAQVVEIVSAMPDSLIALTTRGHTGATRWVLGSTADGLIRTAPVPTLVVRG